LCHSILSRNCRVCSAIGVIDETTLAENQSELCVILKSWLNLKVVIFFIVDKNVANTCKIPLCVQFTGPVPNLGGTVKNQERRMSNCCNGVEGLQSDQMIAIPADTHLLFLS
jgi:hypothetical protein